MTPEELDDMVMAKTGFLVDALQEGRVLQDDGTAAEAREKLVESHWNGEDYRPRSQGRGHNG